MRSETGKPKKDWKSSLRRSIAVRIYLLDQKLNQFNERIRSQNFHASYVYVPNSLKSGRLLFNIAMLIDPDKNDPDTSLSPSFLVAIIAHTHIPPEEFGKLDLLNVDKDSK